jgi:hypothetical protein
MIKLAIICLPLYHLILVGGFNPSEQYEFLSWDDDIPNWMESHKIPWFQTTNTDQPALNHI